MTDAAADYDVIIAGAGLVGLVARARARRGRPLGRAGRSRAGDDRRRRRPATTTGTPACTRSVPGSVAFLRSLGAWQSLPAGSHRARRGDARRGRCRRGAQLLRLRARRARARVDRRGARAAGRARSARGRRRASPSTRPCALDSLTWTADGCALRCAGDIDVARAPRRRRRRPSLACARTRGHRRDDEALRTNGGRRQFQLRARASRPRVPVVPRRWRRSRVAAVAGAPRVDGLVGARGLGARAPRPAARSARRARCSARQSRARRLRADHAGAPGFRCSCRSCRPRSRIGWRWSATPRTASIRSPARASIWVSAMPRRWRRCCGDRGPVTDPGEPLLLERFARRRRAPVLAMQSVTDGLARLFGTTSPLVRTARNLGMAAVDGLPPAKRFLAHSALR